MTGLVVSDADETVGYAEVEPIGEPVGSVAVELRCGTPDSGYRSNDTPNTPPYGNWPSDNSRQRHSDGTFSGAPSNNRLTQITLQSSKSFRLERKNTTVFAKIDESNYFQNTTLLIIVINAIWIGIDTDNNHSNMVESGERMPLYPADMVIEHMFCTYFFIEIVIRFFAFKKFMYCYRDPWFVFDSILVAFMVTETWILPLVGLLMDGGGGGDFLAQFSTLRLLRLLRLTRMAKLTRYFPELLTLVKGMVKAIRSCIFILLFLLLIIYVFAIFFTSQLGKPNLTDMTADPAEDPNGPEMYANIMFSMMTLWTNGVLGDNLWFAIEMVLEVHWVYFWFFAIFFFVSNITMLNMLIGVLCSVIEETSKVESTHLNQTDLRDGLIDAFQHCDASGDGIVTEDEWKAMSGMESTHKMLIKLGVHPADVPERLQQMQQALYGVGDGRACSMSRKNLSHMGLTFDQFVDKILGLRWDADACSLDIEAVMAQWKSEEAIFTHSLKQIDTYTRRLAHFNVKLNADGEVISVGGSPVQAAAGEAAGGAKKGLGRGFPQSQECLEIYPVPGAVPASPSKAGPRQLGTLSLEELFRVIRYRSPGRKTHGQRGSRHTKMQEPAHRGCSRISRQDYLKECFYPENPPDEFLNPGGIPPGPDLRNHRLN